MRKRDALKIALRSLRLPKLSESEKLFYAGLSILFTFVCLGSILTTLTRNVLWLLTFIVGFLISLWFNKASEIIDEWERQIKLNKILREVNEK